MRLSQDCEASAGPRLLGRVGRGGRGPTVQESKKLMPLIEAHTAERVLSDADAYLGFLTAQPEVGAGPVAVTGYCIGGLLATRTAVAHPGQVAAVAAFHGPVGADGPDSMHRLTSKVHLGHAETDLTPEALVPVLEVDRRQVRVLAIWPSSPRPRVNPGSPGPGTA